MRSEVDRDLFAACITQLFFNLRGMTVGRHTIRFHIFIDFAEQIVHFRTASCTGGTGFCIYDNRVRIDDAFFYQRIASQDTAGCIASRIGYQTGFLYILTVDLTQSVHSFFDKLRWFVLQFVPFFIYLYIFDTEIRTQIDDLYFRQNLFID